MGPSSYNCRQQVRCSLLHPSGKSTSFLPGLVAGIPANPRASLLDSCRALLRKGKFDDIDWLRRLPGLPEGKWICRDLGPATEPFEVSPGDPLLHAAILGLCNQAFYSPDRPIIWTESRLRRRVQLFAVGDFYAD